MSQATSDNVNVNVNVFILSINVSKKMLLNEYQIHKEYYIHIKQRHKEPMRHEINLQTFRDVNTK